MNHLSMLGCSAYTDAVLEGVSVVAGWGWGGIRGG